MTEQKLLPNFETYVKHLESLIVGMKDELQSMTYDDAVAKIDDYNSRGFEIEYIEGGNGILIMTLTHEALFCSLHGHDMEIVAPAPQRVDAICRRCEFTIENIDQEIYAKIQRGRVRSLAGA